MQILVIMMMNILTILIEYYYMTKKVDGFIQKN